MRPYVTLAALIVGLSFSSTPVLADLVGSDVTATLYYPNLSTVFSTAGPELLGPLGIDFTTLAFDGTLEVTGTQIIWDATLPENYSAATFNGLVVLFTGAPEITSVTVDAASTLIPVSAAFSDSPTGNSVQFNLEGLSALAGQKAILDVQTKAVAAVPEPNSVVLFGSILLMLVGFKMKLFPSRESRESKRILRDLRM